jgi:pyruvate/2-oxoglutarate dehydrogenase complex dihydrolipoamide dehydrogenase (E3) component
MAEKAGEYMAEEGVKFLRPCIPVRVEQLEAGAPGRLRVTAKRTDNNEEFAEEYNSVLFAIGRDPCTDTIGLENAGICTHCLLLDRNCVICCLTYDI